jgi:FkbM family methyltransferase
MSILDLIGDGGNHKRLLLRRLAQSGRPVLLYGAGIYAYVLNRYLAASGVNVAAAMVDGAFKTADCFMDLPLHATEAMAARLSEFEIVIAITNYPDAIRKLTDLGIGEAHVVDVPDFLNIPQPFMDREFVAANAGQFDTACGLFEDDLSRQTYIAAINAKISEDPVSLLPVVRPDHQYFATTEFPLSDHETLLDVGGFSGDSVREFHAITQGRYDGIISLEPSGENFEALCATIADLGLPRVEPVKMGAWSERTTLRFATREMNIDNKVAEEGDRAIEVDTIDAILDRMGRRVSFIKMDINGAEYHALSGAGETIRRQRPRIATKIHTREDFFRLPIAMKAIAPDIKLYLRQRNFMSLSLVLYGTF